MNDERRPPVYFVLTDKIKVGVRARGEQTADSEGESIDELRASIEREGLLHPIVLDKNYELLAGFRRYSCVKSLGWTEVPCHILSEDLSEAQKLEIELMENLSRKDFTWQERCDLREKIHTVKQRLYGEIKLRDTGQQIIIPGELSSEGWSMQDTADATGTAKSRVSLDIAMARIKREIPALAQVDSMAEAQRQIRKLIEKIEREIAIRKTSHIAQQDIWCGDARKALKHVPDNWIDLVILDPPYGVDVNNVAREEGRLARSEHHYDDNKEDAKELLLELLPELARCMKPNAHLYCFFGISEYPWVFNALRATFGGRCEAIPLIWAKPGNRWGTGDWRIRWPRSYEGIFFVSSPDRTLATVHCDVLQYGAGQDVLYTAEKPLDLVRFLIEQSTQPGEIVLDPTAGHGSTPVAACQLRRRFWAIEDNEEAYKVMRHRVTQEQIAQARKEASANVEVSTNDDIIE